jgi:serine/threonine-protein kinase
MGSTVPASRRPAQKRWLAVAFGVSAACAVIFAAAALMAWRRAAAAARNRDVVRFTMPVAPPNDADGTVIVDVAPDGKTIAYADRSTSDKGGVYVRALNRGEPSLIAGTGGARGISFSPDGGSIAYTTVDDEIRVISLAGGAAVPVVRGASWFSGINWGKDGNIYFVRRDSGVIARVPAKGGAMETIGTMESSSLPLGFRIQRNPRLLPGGRAVAFAVFRGSARGCDIEALDLGTRVAKKIAEGCYVVGVRDGWLLFVSTGGTLEAIAFDEKTHTTRGAPQPLVTGVYVLETEAQIALSDNGTLIYMPAVAARSQLVWVSRDGVETPLGAVIDKPLVAIALSPHGNRVAVSGNTDRETIWMYDISSQTLSPFARDGQLSYRPVWTPDGNSIVFTSDRQNADGLRWLWIRPADGRDSVRLFVASPRHAQEVSWVASSPWVVFRTGFDDGRTNRDLRYFKPGNDTTSHAFLETHADELNPALSPDGRWLAYVSNETGRDEVYVSTFPGPGAALRVSTDGGTGPLWSHDGKSLFYRATDGPFISVSVTGGPSLTFSNRRALFNALPYAWDRQHQSYDISADDRRLLFIRPQGDPTLSVVVNWFDEAAERLNQRR